MLNKLIFDYLSRNSIRFDTDFIDSSKNIVWLPLVYSKDGIRIMGITSTGEWVVKVNQDFFFLDTEDSFLFAISFLETPLSEIQQQISQKINFNTSGIQFEQLFPIFNIINIGLRNGQYWALLAMNWIESLPLKDKTSLFNDLKVLEKSKWAGQNLRQRANREIKKIKQYTDGINKD